MTTPIPSFTLNNGLNIPSIGVGTWMGAFDDSVRKEGHQTALLALQTGYRYIDTAAAYNTEAVIAEAIRECGIGRQDIVVQTKLSMTHHNGRVREGFENSLKELGLEYIDVYLMHWPIAFNDDWSLNDYPFTKVWEQMETLLADGKCKSIGVSNFSIRNLEILLRTAKIVPCINQVEMHPYLPQVELKAYCEKKGIHLQAYTPLGSADSPIAQEAVVQDIAKRYNVTPSQVILAWGVSRGTSVLPKSSNPERLKLNITPPSLLPEEVEAITNIHLEDESKHRSIFFPGGKDALVLGMSREQLGWDR